MKQSTTPVLLRDVSKGKVDVAFCGKLGDAADVVFDPIWSQPAVLVVNRLHPFAKRNEVSLEELAGHFLISYSLTGPLASELTDLVKGYDLLVDCLYPDEITLASLVAGNPDIMAIACRSWLLDSYDNDVKLVRIIEAPEAFHQMYLCFADRASRPRTVDMFIETVKTYCSTHATGDASSL